MKKTTALLTLAGAMAVTSTQAQVEITITGATSFRSIIQDRVAYLFDSGYVRNNPNSNTNTHYGTMNARTTLGTMPVTVRLSFSGSGTGMNSVKNSTAINTALQTPTNATLVAWESRVPDFAFSDVYPSSASPSIPNSSLTDRIVGVVPFVFARNTGLTGVDNITRDQALLLMTASGAVDDGEGGWINGMPATFLGGSSSNPLYLVGRDSGSGTRITVQKCIGFTGTPNLWATNGVVTTPGDYTLSGGYSSGSSVVSVLKGKNNAIGYTGLADYYTATNSSGTMLITSLQYNGVPFSHANVINGKYALWGYQHMVNRLTGLSANQITLGNAIFSAITNASFQATAIYSNSFTSLAEMQVTRGSDGGKIVSKNF
jgi:hypothetical protein